MSRLTDVTLTLNTPGSLLYKETEHNQPRITINVRKTVDTTALRDEVMPAIVRITQRSTGTHVAINPDETLQMNLKRDDELWIATNNPNLYTAWVSW